MPRLCYMRLWSLSHFLGELSRGCRVDAFHATVPECTSCSVAWRNQGELFNLDLRVLSRVKVLILGKWKRNGRFHGQRSFLRTWCQHVGVCPTGEVVKGNPKEYLINSHPSKCDKEQCRHPPRIGSFALHIDVTSALGHWYFFRAKQYDVIATSDDFPCLQ